MKVVGSNSIIGWTFFQIIFVVKIVIFGRKYEKMNADGVNLTEQVRSR